MKRLVELRLPNVLGSEKIALEKAASVAREMGFSKDRIEDLKTAVAEACINAIEHGNKFDQDAKVGITLNAGEDSLQVVVSDEGNGINPEKIPKKRLTENGFPQRRGYGVYLIKNLVNEFSFENIPGKGNNVKMLIHLNK